ncbi:selenocysteine lyase [Lewinellaceae bacterium SD302]|nr:selenocysteine lyase [Lewinellaceae bacterium SD302]
MQDHFASFRRHVIGIDQTIATPFGEQLPIVYMDWTASGRCYAPIERRLSEQLMPFVANTHTETNATGQAMTHAYHEARNIIKEHVNAGPTDVLISSNAGMTGVINKFQRILGLRVYEKYSNQVVIAERDRPVIFVTHMEHHSNQTSWLETIGEVVVVAPNAEGLVCLEKFAAAIEKYADRPNKIAAVTSCSNVTGLFTPYYDIAEMIHAAGGLCFVDFACSAPYVDIDMHPEGRPNASLDAIYFSPHKFLGGPGSTGILVFNQSLYSNTVPDNPGGGTVDWTNPWGQHKFVDDIEAREDGGTPAFLQTMRVALCIRLKDEMGVDNILAREHQQLARIFAALDEIPNLHVLANQHRDRLGVISFYIDELHYNLAVKMLNDRFGIQTRGGCSCAGTYGHYLLNVQPEVSDEITSQISSGNCASKPGWVRLSVHPTTTDEEIEYALKALSELAANHREWAKEYRFDWSKNHLEHQDNSQDVALKDKMSQCLFGRLTEVREAQEF